MSIRRNRNATSTASTAVLEQPAPQPMEAIAHPRIEVRTPTEMNGYLDPDQTLVNFAVRELGMSFKQLIADDPSRLLRNWLKCYKTAWGTAIGTLGLGTAALIVGVGVGAWPLSLAGFLTMGGCGLLVKHHNQGVKACELEAEIIDEIRPVLELFYALEVRGANPSDLVSLYDRLIRQYSAQNPAFGLIGDPQHLKEFFEVELAKHHTLSGIANTPTGLVTASTIPVQQPAIAPAASEPTEAIANNAPSETSAPQPVTSAPPTTSGELLERLKAECPTLLKLIKSPPIRVVGHQRTGKSSFARKLVCLRLLFLPNHQSAYATPHAEADNPVPAQLNPFGFNNGKDFRTIERFWVGVQKGIDAGKNLNLSVIWDEFGSYDAFEDLEPLGKGLRSLLRESSKHSYYPILIAHGDQASFYPGVANILTTLKASTVKVETIGEPVDDFGSMAPTDRAVVTWLDGTTEDLVLPSWLTVSFLLNLLPPTVSTPSVASTANPEESKNQPTATAKTPQETGEAYPTKEAESLKDEDAIARVRTRLVEKILELNGEWVSVSKLVQDFRADDRQVVKQLIQSAVMSGVLQCEERDNPNGTKSQFVKVVSRDSANKNQPT